MPKLKVYRVGDMDAELCRRHRALSFGYINGCLCEDLTYARRVMPDEAKVLSLVDDTERILAWALTMPTTKRGVDRLDFEVYTRYSERRKGYAKKLYVKACAMAGEHAKIMVHPHDKVSRGFFKEMNNYYPSKDYK